MGSTLGSILQSVGQTGNEAAAGDIAAQRQSHEFTMDYLANQARNRGLDIQENLGQQNIDLEKQRLAQSRWQLLPGYNAIPDPNNPGNTLYRHTFVDPITKQQTFFDTQNPPPGSPQYNMNTFKFMRDNAKKEGIDLPINTLLSISGMKVDTPADVNNKYQTYWQQLTNEASKDPVAKAALNKDYPGGYVDFFNQMIKGEHLGFSNEDWIKYVMGNGLTKAGNQPVNQMDLMYERTLTQSQGYYQKAIADNTKVLQAMGISGKFLNPSAYQATLDNITTAQQNLNDVNTQLQQFRSRSATPPEPGPSVNVHPAATNPPMAQDVAVGLGATHIAKNPADGNWYWTNDDGSKLIGPAPAPTR